MEGVWDGYQRINSDQKSGGIVGVFKQGAKETSRMVTVNFVDPAATYQVKMAPDGRLVQKMSGKELQDKGFKVELNGKYDGALFEIEAVK
jgi:alpha-galactosidase